MRDLSSDVRRAVDRRGVLRRPLVDGLLDVPVVPRPLVERVVALSRVRVLADFVSLATDNEQPAGFAYGPRRLVGGQIHPLRALTANAQRQRVRPLRVGL